MPKRLISDSFPASKTFAPGKTVEQQEPQSGKSDNVENATENATYGKRGEHLPVDQMDCHDLQRVRHSVNEQLRYRIQSLEEQRRTMQIQCEALQACRRELNRMPGPVVPENAQTVMSLIHKAQAELDKNSPVTEPDGSRFAGVSDFALWPLWAKITGIVVFGITFLLLIFVMVQLFF